MKIPLIYRRRALCVTFSLIITCPAIGQTQVRGGRPENPAKVHMLNIHRQAAENAKVQALAGNLAEAEKALDELGSAPKNSAARQFDTAQRLTELANTLMRSGEPRAAKAAAARALAALATAEGVPANISLRSAIQIQKGILHERFLGDDASALMAFQAAVQLEPGNAAAREKLTRVKEAQANLHGKAAASSR